MSPPALAREEPPLEWRSFDDAVNSMPVVLLDRRASKPALQRYLAALGRVVPAWRDYLSDYIVLSCLVPSGAAALRRPDAPAASSSTDSDEMDEELRGLRLVDAPAAPSTADDEDVVVDLHGLRLVDALFYYRCIDALEACCAAGFAVPSVPAPVSFAPMGDTLPAVAFAALGAECSAVDVDRMLLAACVADPFRVETQERCTLPMVAAMSGNAAWFIRYLRARDPVALRRTLNAHASFYQHTALAYAIDMEDVEGVRAMLEAGADATLKLSGGRTALMIAAGAHLDDNDGRYVTDVDARIRILQLLVAAGARFDDKDTRGDAAADHARLTRVRAWFHQQGCVFRAATGDDDDDEELRDCDDVITPAGHARTTRYEIPPHDAPIVAATFADNLDDDD